MHRHRIVLIALIALLPMGCATQGQQHAEMLARLQTIRSIAIVPAEVNFSNDTVSDGAQRDEAREQSIQKELRLTAENRLRRQGYVINTQLYEKILKPDSEIAFEFEQFKQRYAQLIDEAAQSETTGTSTATAGRTLGPHLLAWASDSNADAILLVRYRGIELSTQKAVLESIPGVVLAAVTGDGYTKYKKVAGLDAALIDAVSGEILWRNTATNKHRQVQKTIQKTMDLPPQGMLSKSLDPLTSVSKRSPNNASPTTGTAQAQKPSATEETAKTE